MAALTVVIAGIRGRMGRQIAQLAVDDPAVDLVGVTVRPGDELAGRTITLADMEGTEHDFPAADILAGLQQAPDVVIDFTTPDNTLSMLDTCRERMIAMVVGTTGFDEAQEARIREAAQHVPIVKAGNMSLGVNLLSTLVELAATALGPDYDIEIHEAHHRHKKDAPSGTALMLGEAAAKGRGVMLKDKAVHDRHGVGAAREPGAIGFSVTRAGGIIGEHQVLFGGAEETITLSHTALDRSVFARGALAAAKWLEEECEAPGLYSMRDVLGL